MRMLLEDEQEEEKKPPGCSCTHSIACGPVDATRMRHHGCRPCRHTCRKDAPAARQHLPQRPHLPRLRPRPRLRPPTWSRATRRSTPRRPQRRRATARAWDERRRGGHRRQLMDWTRSVPGRGPRARPQRGACYRRATARRCSSRPSKQPRGRGHRCGWAAGDGSGCAHVGVVEQRMGRTQTRYCPSQRARPRDHAPPRPHRRGRRGRHRPPTQRVR